MAFANVEDFKIALRDLSEICKFASVILLAPLLFTLYYAKSYDISLFNRLLAFVAPSMSLYLLYIILSRIKKGESKTRTRHIMITVSLAWLIIPLIGSLPFVLTSTLGPLDSIFESFSGWTTTGMTMIVKPENLFEIGEQDILFYRSFTQWVGGVGIIVLALFVFMRSGTIAMDYYAFEMSEQKIKPSLKSTVKETWKIYSLYTIACIILLFVSGMDMFDSITHSFTAIATGGFSTHSQSIGYFNNHPNSVLIQGVLMIFMLLGATSFLIHFRLFEGKTREVIENIELRYMLLLLVIAVLAISVILYIGGYEEKIFGDLMDSVFHVVAAGTCTGFSIADISAWPDSVQWLLMILMYIGGLYGSTAGGIKILRFVVIVNVIYYCIKRLSLPKSAMLRIKISGNKIGWEEIVYVFGLSALYIIIAVLGSWVMMDIGFTGTQSMSLSLSAMGNVGLTPVPSDMWFGMSPIGKIILIVLMVVGRLEIFPLLVLLSSLIYIGKKSKS